MARLAENRTQHWLTPSRSAEADLPAGIMRAIHQTTATADPESLTKAIGATWAYGRRSWQQLAERAGRNIPDNFFNDLDAAIRK
jgi:lincosamide nucleotidyltransferase B/F